jgi:hypothetical protein
MPIGLVQASTVEYVANVQLNEEPLVRTNSSFLAIFALLGLAGCDQLPGVTKTPEQQAAEVVTIAPEPAAPDLVAETAALGWVVYKGGLDGVRVPNTLASRLDADGVLILEGKLQDPQSTGMTDGASFQVSPEIESEVSGRVIKIHLVVASEQPGQAFVAYSTSDVGNSGWMTFDVTPEGGVTTLQFAVPVMQNPGADFIGLDPNGLALSIKAIVLEVVEPA